MYGDVDTVLDALPDSCPFWPLAVENKSLWFILMSKRPRNLKNPVQHFCR